MLLPKGLGLGLGPGNSNPNPNPNPNSNPNQGAATQGAAAAAAVVAAVGARGAVSRHWPLQLLLGGSAAATIAAAAASAAAVPAAAAAATGSASSGAANLTSAASTATPLPSGVASGATRAAATPPGCEEAEARQRHEGEVTEPDPPATLPSAQQGSDGKVYTTSPSLRATATAGSAAAAAAAAAAARQRVTWNVPSANVVGGDVSSHDDGRGFDLQDVWKVGGVDKKVEGELNMPGGVPGATGANRGGGGGGGGDRACAALGEGSAKHLAKLREALRAEEFARRCQARSRALQA